MNKILIVIVAIALDRIFKKTCPVLYKKLELPTNILLTIFIAVYCGIWVYAIYDVAISAVSTVDKVFFTLFMCVAIGIFVTIAVLTWKRWWKERKADQEDVL